MQIFKFRAIIFTLLLLTAFTKRNEGQILKGDYLGQVPPGHKPEIFAPNIISTGLSELNSVFSPDGKEFYFCVRNSPSATVYTYKNENGQWKGPKALPFASIYNEIDISLSPDGNRIYFCSRKPVSPEQQLKEDYDFWMSERKGDTWNEPVNLGDSVNSKSHDFYPIMTNSGTIYFSSQREGEGTNNIYMSKFIDEKFTPAEKLGIEINTEYREFDPYVSPDERFIIFSSDRPEGLGSGDLYISFKNEDGTWTPSRNIGEPINTPGPEFCPMLSPDGKYFFFTSGGRAMPEFPKSVMKYDDYIKVHNSPGKGSTDIYWVDAIFVNKIAEQIKR